MRHLNGVGATSVALYMGRLKPPLPIDPRFSEALLTKLILADGRILGAAHRGRPIWEPAEGLPYGNPIIGFDESNTYNFLCRMDLL